MKKSVYLAHHAFPPMYEESKAFIPFLSPLAAYVMRKATTLTDLIVPKDAPDDFHAMMLDEKSLFRTDAEWKQQLLQAERFRPTYNKVLVKSINGKTPVFTTKDLQFAKRVDWFDNNHSQTVGISLMSAQNDVDAGKDVVIVVTEEFVQDVQPVRTIPDLYGQSTFIRPSIMDGDCDDVNPQAARRESSRHHLAMCIYKDVNELSTARYNPDKLEQNHREHLQSVDAAASMMSFDKPTKIMTRNGTEFVLQDHANALLFLHDFKGKSKPLSDSDQVNDKFSNPSFLSHKLNFASDVKKSCFVYTGAGKTNAISSAINYKQRFKKSKKMVRFKKVEPNKLVILETQNIDMSLAENAVVAACAQHNLAGTYSEPKLGYHTKR